MFERRTPPRRSPTGAAPGGRSADLPSAITIFPASIRVRTAAAGATALSGSGAELRRGRVTVRYRAARSPGETGTTGGSPEASRTSAKPPPAGLGVARSGRGGQRQVAAAGADLHARPRDLHRDRAVLAVERFLRRDVADDVVGAGVLLDLVERAAEVVFVADREAAGVDGEAVGAVCPCVSNFGCAPADSNATG